MKKPLLAFILVACLAFFGLSKAYALAPRLTVGYVVPPSTPSTITYGSTGVVLVGFSAVTNAYTTGNANVTQIVFSTNYNGGGQTLTNYFASANLQLWYTTNSNLTGGTEIAGAGIGTSTVAVTGGTTLTFAGFTQAQSPSQTYYYYVVGNYNVANTTTNFELDETNVVSVATVSYATGAAGDGGNYTLSLPPVTAVAASLTTTVSGAGLNSTNPINIPANYAVYGMSLTPSATGTAKALTGLTFTTTGSPTQTDNYFYATAYLYSSNVSSYDGTAVKISTITPVPASNTLSFGSFTTAQSITAGTTKYYYVVIVYSTGVVATANQTITYSSATATATVTAGATVAGPNYTYGPVAFVAATATSLTTTIGAAGLSTSTNINAAGNYAVYGMALTPAASGTPSALTGLTFTTSGTPAQTDDYFYATAYLYSSNVSSYDGTAVKISTINPVPASNTLTFTGFTAAQTITAGTTKYYYVVIIYTAPGVAATATQTVTYSSATTTSTVTAGSPVAGPSYTYSPVPALTAVDIPASYLTPTAIYIGQTDIALAGIAMQTNSGTTPLTKLTFSYTPTAAATLVAYFTSTSVKLVSTTTTPTMPYTGAGTSTIVTYPTNMTISGGVITITVPTTSIGTTPIFFYLVADYTVPGGATPTTFKFAPSGYTTGYSGAVTLSTSSYPLNTFTCTTPTYYWTGNAGDNNWLTAANWEISTSTNFSNGYYPGQIYITYPGSTLDAVDIAPVSTTNTINLGASLNVNTINFEAGRTTNLNVNTGFTLTNNYFNIGATSGSSTALVILAGGGILKVISTGTVAAINNAATLTVTTGGNLAFANNSGLNINGATATPAKLVLSGGNITALNADFDLVGTSSSIQATSGTFTATNTSGLGLDGANAFVTNSGANVTFTDPSVIYTSNSSNAITNNSGTFTVTGAVNTFFTKLGFLIDPGSLVINGGTVNLNTDGVGSTDLELGDGFGGVGTLSQTGGTLNVTGGSIIHMAYTNSTVTNNGGTINVNTGSTINADYAQLNNITGTVNVDNSLVELAVGGVSLTNAGSMNFTNGSVINYTFRQSVLNNTGGTFNATNTTVNFSSNNCALNVSAGAFNLNTGSVINMSSTKSALTNSGTGTFTCAPTSIFNLSASVTAANAPTVTNTSANPFTFLSDATGSATIGKITTIGTTGSFIGSFNVQRYISTASRNYRLLSCPVNQTQATPGTAAAPNIVNISDLAQTITNPAIYHGAFLGGPGAGFPNYVANPIMYLYQESILPGTTGNSSFTSGKNVGIINISGSGSSSLVSTKSTAAGGTTASDNSTSVKIPAGNAYLLYYIHDNTSANVTDPLTTATTTASGYINQGSIPFVLWGAGTLSTAMTLTTGSGSLYPGVTMVGNPYPSTIDLQAVYNDNKASGTGIFTNGTSEAFYELDPSTEQFVSYNYNGSGAGTFSGSTASRYIASGQGFYVTVTNNGKALTFNEDQKTPSTATPTFPSPLLESFPVHPNAIVDNVSEGGGKVSNELYSLPGNAKTPVTYASNTSASRQNTLGGSSNLSLASNKIGSIHLNPPKHPADSGKVYHYPKTDTTVTPPVINTLAGLHLKLVMDTVNFDECGLYFIKDGFDKFDKSDSHDLDGNGGKVFLSSYTTDRVRTSINSMGGYANDKRVPLYVRFSASGLYKLQMEDIANINTNNYSVFLIDNLKKDSLDLTLYKSYNFNYTAGTAGDSTRFVLAIDHKPVPHYELVAFAGQKVTRGVQLNWSTKNEAATTTFVVQKLVNNSYAFLDSLHSDDSGAYNDVDQHPSLGTNTYRLQQTDALGNITYSAPVTIGYNSASPNGDLVVYPNPAKSTITVTLNSSSTTVKVATVDVYNSSGTVVSHRVVSSNSFNHDISNYKLGVYIIELKNSNGMLVGKSKFIKVE